MHDRDHRRDEREHDGLEHERAEQRRVRGSRCLQHREVADAFERGEVHDQRDDPRGDDPQQRLDEVDRLLAARRRPLQVGLDLGVRQDVEPVQTVARDSLRDHRAGERLSGEREVLGVVERHEDRVDAEVVPEVGRLAHDARRLAADDHDVADVLVEAAVDEDLTLLASAPVLPDLRCAHAAGHVAEQVHIGQRASFRSWRDAVIIGDAARTPGALLTASMSSSTTNLVAVNGPDAPRATTQRSPSNESTIWSTSWSRPLLMPAMIRVMAKTTDVASAAIMNRRRRNCRSRTPTSHTPGV